MLPKNLKIVLWQMFLTFVMMWTTMHAVRFLYQFATVEKENPQIALIAAVFFTAAFTIKRGIDCIGE